MSTIIIIDDKFLLYHCHRFLIQDLPGMYPDILKAQESTTTTNIAALVMEKWIVFQAKACNWVDNHPKGKIKIFVSNLYFLLHLLHVILEVDT